MITLSSDFGSPYPAAMKGVILGRTEAQLVDVAHDFPRQEVRQAAFWLREVLPYFPRAVHLVVVDPGVGTGRGVLVAKTGGHVLVGPDNGVLVPVAERIAGDPTYHLTQPEDPDTTTFHGRDVFAPLAADIHRKGSDAILERDRFTPSSDVVRIDFPEPDLGPEEARGEILVVDGFGNAVANIPGTFIHEAIGGTVQVNDQTVPAVRTYASVPPGAPLVTEGSHENVELAANRGRGADAFGVEVGDQVHIRLEG